MRARTIVLVAVFLGMALSAWSVPQAASPQTPTTSGVSASTSTAPTVRQFVTQDRVACHNQRTQTAGLGA